MASSLSTDIDFFLASVDGFLQMAALFTECNEHGQEQLLEEAERTRRDVVYLEPVLPQGARIGLPMSKINLRISNNLYHAHKELTDAKTIAH